MFGWCFSDLPCICIARAVIPPREQLCLRPSCLLFTSLNPRLARVLFLCPHRSITKRQEGGGARRHGEGCVVGNGAYTHVFNEMYAVLGFQCKECLDKSPFSSGWLTPFQTLAYMQVWGCVCKPPSNVLLVICTGRTPRCSFALLHTRVHFWLVW